MSKKAPIKKDSKTAHALKLNRATLGGKKSAPFKNMNAPLSKRKKKSAAQRKTDEVLYDNAAKAVKRQAASAKKTQAKKRAKQ